jgi:hypothetical protein
MLSLTFPAALAAGASTPSGPQLAAAKECRWTDCAAVLSAVAAATKVSHVPADLTPTIEASMTDIFPPPGLGGCAVSQPALTTTLPCVYNASAPKRMVLIGDSHAEMWAPAIADIAKANGYSLLFLAKIPCPLPMVGFWNEINFTSNTQCTTWKKWAIAHIQQFNPSIVIAATEDFNPYKSNDTAMKQSEFSSGLVTALKDLSAPGRRVILLGDIPYHSLASPACLAQHETSVQRCSDSTSGAVLAPNQAAEHAAAIKAGASYVNVVPWLCTPKSCPVIIDNIEVYVDGFHITATYATWLEPVLSQSLDLPLS